MNNAGTNKTCLTVLELASRLGVGRNRAYELACSEGFPTVRIGKRLLIPVDALDRWLNEHAGKGAVTLTGKR